jgi:hypothetical protein
MTIRRSALLVRGFVVVRISTHNTRESAVVPAQPPPRIDEICYSGFDRMPWNDLNLAFYDGSLPHGLRRIREDIWRSSRPDLDYRLCSNLDDASSLLNFSNRSAPKNEIIALDSLLLSGSAKATSSRGGAHWLGADIYCHGFGSLLLQGVFARPDSFSDFVPLLNEHGLFDLASDESIAAYKSAYNERAGNAGIEIVEAKAGFTDTVYIGEVEGKG